MQEIKNRPILNYYDTFLYEESQGNLTGESRTYKQTFPSRDIKFGLVKEIPHSTLIDRIKTFGAKSFKVIVKENPLTSSKELWVFEDCFALPYKAQIVIKNCFINSMMSKTPEDDFSEALWNLRYTFYFRKPCTLDEQIGRDIAYIIHMVLLTKSSNYSSRFLSDKKQVSKCQEFISQLKYDSSVKEKTQELLEESDKGPYAMYLLALFYQLTSNLSQSKKCFLDLSYKVSCPLNAVDKAYTLTNRNHIKDSNQQQFLIDQLFIKCLQPFYQENSPICFIGTNADPFNTPIHNQLILFLNTVGIKYEFCCSIRKHNKMKALKLEHEGCSHIFIDFVKTSRNYQNRDPVIINEPEKHLEKTQDYFIKTARKKIALSVSFSHNKRGLTKGYSMRLIKTFHSSLFSVSYNIFQLLGPLLDVSEERIRDVQSEFLLLSREILNSKFGLFDLALKEPMDDAKLLEFINRLLFLAAQKNFPILVRDLLKACHLQQWELDIESVLRHVISQSYYSSFNKETFLILMEYLQNSEIVLNTPDSRGETLFCKAFTSGIPEIVEALLKAGANPNTPIENDLTALSFTFKKLQERKFECYRSPYQQIIELLLQYGASIPEAIQSAEKADLSPEILKELNMLFGRNTKNATT